MKIFSALQRFKIIPVVLLSGAMTVTSICTVAQDFKQALEKLKQAYGNLEKLHAVIFVQVFEDTIKSTPYYKVKADIQRNGSSYSYQFGDNDMVMNDHYLVVIDRKEHEIVWSTRDTKAENAFFSKAPLQMNMDSLLSQYGTAFYRGRVNGVDHYRIKHRAGTIDQIDMMLDMNLNLLKGVRYHYTEGYYVKIDFEVFDVNPVFGKNTFSEQTYMVREKGKLKPADGYSHYTIQEVVNK